MVLIYNPILALVKNSMLILYLHLEGGAMYRLRHLIKTIIAINTALMVAIFIVAMFQCIPISKTWFTTEPGYCIDKGAFYTATAALNILTDIPVVIIPSVSTYSR